MSVYGLIVEEGTPLERLVTSGRMVLPDEDIAADMYELVQRLLTEAGFERYEISNYAKNGQYSRHNTVYWQYHPYVAFGAAGCGFDVNDKSTAGVGNTYYYVGAKAKNSAGLAEATAYRRTAICTVPEYIEVAKSLTSRDWRTSELYSIEAITPSQQLEEFMFMGLRRVAGADLAEAQARFGVDVWQRYGLQLEPIIKKGLARYDGDKQRLWLTPKGMEIGNQIFAIFVDA